MTPQQYGLLATVILVVVIPALIKLLGKSGDRKPRKAAPRPDGSVEIYVGNISYKMTDSQLRAEFAKYGVVHSARIVTERQSGRSKGYGFVIMPHRGEAETAIRAINGTEVMGRPIRCNEAREDSRPEGRN